MILTGAARSFFLTQGGQKLHVYSYPPGEMFGGMALVARNSDYIVSTETLKDSYMLAWDHANISKADPPLVPSLWTRHYPSLRNT